MAAELPFAQRMIFNTKKTPKIKLKRKKIDYFCRYKLFESYPGHATAVIRTFFFHFSPPNTMKNRLIELQIHTISYFYKNELKYNQRVFPKEHNTQ
jgi:hypothetical protein